MTVRRIVEGAGATALCLAMTACAPSSGTSTPASGPPVSAPSVSPSNTPVASAVTPSTQPPSATSASNPKQSVSPPAATPSTPTLDPQVRAVTRTELGASWHEGCPLHYSHLRALTVSHYGFDGAIHRGTVIVRDTAVPAFEALFTQALETKFPIRLMQNVDAYGAVDEASAEADNTSAFNCRMTTGGSQWSEHSYGTAIDINPVENPYHRSGVMVPTNGKAYLDRRNVRPGMLVSGTPLLTFALAHGWTWLSAFDTQHLQRPRER